MELKVNTQQPAFDHGSPLVQTQRPTCYHLAHFGQADVACTYAACVARTVGYLPVHQTRRSAAGSRSHASLDQRAVDAIHVCVAQERAQNKGLVP